MSAEAVVDSARSWQQLREYFRWFGHCDDGAIGEGFSESVSQLLAVHWGQLARLQQIADADESFHRFVLRHLDESVPYERRRRIRINATRHCPSTSQALCQEIAQRASTP